MEWIFVDIAAVAAYFVYAAITFTPAKIDEAEDEWWRSIK